MVPEIADHVEQLPVAVGERVGARLRLLLADRTRPSGDVGLAAADHPQGFADGVGGRGAGGGGLMMQTHKAKRVEIIIEAPMESRLTTALEKAGVTGFTVLPVLGGSGRSGRWRHRSSAGRWTATGFAGSPWRAVSSISQACC